MSFCLPHQVNAAIGDGGHCSLEQTHLNELTWTLACLELKDSQKVEQSSQVDAKKRIEDFCDQGFAAFFDKSRVIELTGFATMTLATEYLLSERLISKLMPKISDELIESFMKEVGMTIDSATKAFSRQGTYEVPEEFIKARKEKVRRYLAIYILKVNDYLPNLDPSKELAKLATYPSDAFELAIENGNNGGFRTNVAEKTDKQMVRMLSKDLKKPIAKDVTNVLEKMILGENRVAIRALLKDLGRFQMPFVSRLPILLFVGTVGGIVTNVSLGLESKATGCSDEVDLSQVVDRDTEKKCSVIPGVTPQVLKGLGSPDQTKLILDKYKVACDAYTNLYREVVLQIKSDDPAKLTVSCETDQSNFRSVSWKGLEVNGYRIEKIEGKKPIGFEITSGPQYSMNRPAVWKKSHFRSEPIQKNIELILGRELESYCMKKEGVLGESYQVISSPSSASPKNNLPPTKAAR